MIEYPHDISINMNLDGGIYKMAEQTDESKSPQLVRASKSINISMQGYIEKKNAPSSNDLSDREKDIVVQVAKGLSNKEIADALFISVNTVMTHRRNISRKLQIHSPAALTIYALVNGLVNLDEISV